MRAPLTPHARVRALTRGTLHGGVVALAAVDPMMRTFAERWGVPPLWARRPGFPTLVRIILEQQVSLAAAATMYRNLVAHAGGMTPRAIARLGVDGLRRFGLTRQKSAFVQGLAERVLEGRLDLPAISRARDDEAHAMLVAVPGIGPWSADIYALMALRRPDVWPRGDLALAVTLRDAMGLPTSPSRGEQERMAERWAPWRSIAARLLWAEYLGVRGKLEASATTPFAATSRTVR